MLHAELQRLARELSASDAMSPELSDGEGSSGDTTTQIQQLNLLLSFVAMAQKPLTVDQLDLILEVILEEEVLNLEDDLRTAYSSLFSLRPALGEGDKGEDDDDDGDWAGRPLSAGGGEDAPVWAERWPGRSLRRGFVS